MSTNCKAYSSRRLRFKSLTDSILAKRKIEYRCMATFNSNHEY